MTHKTKNKVLGGLVAAIVLLFGVGQCRENQLAKVNDQLTHASVNLRAENDSLRITKNKNNEPEYNKFAYLVSSVDELKQSNVALANELQAVKGKVGYIAKTDFKIVHDTTTMFVEKPEVRDGVYTVKSSIDTTFSPGNYRKISTLTTVDTKDTTAKSVLTKDEIGFTAVTGLKKAGSGYEIFVTPKYPGMTITQLEGAVVDKNLLITKKKVPTFSFGANIGATPVTYDFKDKKFDFNPFRIGGSVGVNIHF